MNYQLLCTCCSIVLFCFCTHTTEIPKTSINLHAYVGQSDSIAQNLEIMVLDSSHVQFVLRVENKYRDTIDSYMGSAASADHIHYVHTRKNCTIDFELNASSRTALITKCLCPELTVQPSDINMMTDSLEMNLTR